MKSPHLNEWDFDRLRLQMVEDQIVRRGITSTPVLQALRTIPRHLFVPPECRHESYSDSPLPIGYNQTISQPYIVALMTDLLDCSREIDVLEIGTGSGYQTAVLSLLVRHIVTVEIIPELADTARHVLAKIGLTNIDQRCGDADEVVAEDVLFDRIIVTAAPEEVPESLLKHLKDEGIMICPVGFEKKQRLYIFRKNQDRIEVKSGPGVRFVPLTGGNRE